MSESPPLLSSRPKARPCRAGVEGSAFIIWSSLFDTCPEFNRRIRYLLTAVIASPVGPWQSLFCHSALDAESTISLPLIWRDSKYEIRFTKPSRPLDAVHNKNIKKNYSADSSSLTISTIRLIMCFRRSIISRNTIYSSSDSMKNSLPIGL